MTASTAASAAARVLKRPVMKVLDIPTPLRLSRFETVRGLIDIHDVESIQRDLGDESILRHRPISVKRDAAARGTDAYSPGLFLITSRTVDSSVGISALNRNSAPV